MSTRRDFLKTGASAALASRMAFGQAADRKLKLGVIGCGWYGNVDLKAAFAVGNVEAAALCDVDTEHLATSAAEVEKLTGAKPKTYKDYEELIAQPGLDAIIIGTMPHWHALPFLAATKKGLPIYCEKPLSYDIREGRAMVDAAKSAGNVVQVGFQRRQMNGYEEAARYIKSGAAGRIVNVDAQIHYTAGLKDPKPQDPPTSLDWDRWCGPAPKLPYSPQIGHMNWRLEKEYGNGHLVDWGIHLIDRVRYTLGLGMPKTVTAQGGIYHLKGRITTPDTLTVHFEFDQLPVVWKHRLWGAAEVDPTYSNGVFYYGEKQTVFATDNRWAVIPKPKEGEAKSVSTAEIAKDAGKNHMANFLDAVRGKSKVVCPIEDGYASTTTVHLGMIAYELGRIHWDAEKETVVGPNGAGRLVKREYRKPYQHPGKKA
jgi:predicted dehydrogenase